MQSIPKPFRKKSPAKGEFGLGVLPTYTGHHARANLFGDDICHAVLFTPGTPWIPR